MSNTSVIVVQRQTLDWAAQTPDSFRPLSEAFCRLWSKPEDYVFRLMQLWNRTFSIGYFETRAKLKAISTRNLLSISGIEFVPYNSYKNIPDKRAFYLFMDDDDWAGADLGVILGAQSPDAHGRCMTNNYAVSNVWLDHLSRLDSVIQHYTASLTLAALDKPLQLNAVLTASNKSPCSSVSLDRGLGGDLSPEKLATLVDDYLTRMATLLPEHVHSAQWVAPLVAETVALFRDVSASRIN
jgi:hypothetical protein